MLKRTQDRASIRTGTLRVMYMQFLGVAVVCKSEHRGFKKTKERQRDSANLETKGLREIMLKNS
jgi:hypothetical protein